MSLSQLKNLETKRFDLDELIALSAEGKALLAEFKALGVDEPEWLVVAVKSITLDVRARQADAIEKKLRQAKARIQALKPASERRAELEELVKQLEAAQK